jgi:hypothetical protein
MIAGLGKFCPDARDLTCDPRDGAFLEFPVRQEKILVNILRIVGITLPTILALMFHYSLYSRKLLYMKSKNQVTLTSTIFSTSALRNSFLLEGLVLMVHVFPYVDDVNVNSHSPVLYLCLCNLMFLRLLFLFRIVRYMSSLNSSNGRFIG